MARVRRHNPQRMKEIAAELQEYCNSRKSCNFRYNCVFRDKEKICRLAGAPFEWELEGGEEDDNIKKGNN